MKNIQDMTDQEKYQEADKQLFRAFRLLEENNLLYFKVLKKMNFLIDPTFQHIGAVGYNKKNGQIYMILQQDAMLQGSREDVAGLTEHECGHVLYEHIFDIDSKHDHQLMNICQDLIINDSCHYIVSRMNDILAQGSKSILSGGCFFSEFQKKYPVLKNHESQNLTSVQLYNLLKEDFKKDQDQQGKDQQSQDSEGSSNGQGQGQSQDQQENESQGDSQGNKESSKGQSKDSQGKNKGNQTLDSHDQYEIVKDENGQEKAVKVTDQKNQAELNSEVKAKIKEMMGEALEQLKREGKLEKAIGQLSGQMKILVQDLVKSRTDKNSIFNFLTRLSIGTKRKWTKLHRRYPYQAKGSRKNKKPKLALVIDTSGSMGSEELFELIQHQSLVLVNRCEQLWIVVGDTRMEYSMFVKRKNQFKVSDVIFKGGGGTNLQFGWDFAKENNLDGVIVHTDGHIGKFNDHNLKTIFYLYGKGNLEQGGYQNIQVFPL